MQTLGSMLSRPDLDPEVAQSLLETVLTLVDPSTDRPGAAGSGDTSAAAENATRLLGDAAAVDALLSLASSPAMMSRLLCVQLLSALHAAKPDACSRAVLRAERGLGRLLARLDDHREEVRNDVLVLLGRMTAGSKELQTFVAFDDGHARLLRGAAAEAAAIRSLARRHAGEDAAAGRAAPPRRGGPSLVPSHRYAFPLDAARVARNVLAANDTTRKLFVQSAAPLRDALSLCGAGNVVDGSGEGVKVVAAGLDVIEALVGSGGAPEGAGRGDAEAAARAAATRAVDVRVCQAAAGEPRLWQTLGHLAFAGVGGAGGGSGAAARAARVLAAVVRLGGPRAQVTASLAAIPGAPLELGPSEVVAGMGPAACLVPPGSDSPGVSVRTLLPALAARATLRPRDDEMGAAAAALTRALLRPWPTADGGPADDTGATTGIGHALSPPPLPPVDDAEATTAADVDGAAPDSPGTADLRSVSALRVLVAALASALASLDPRSPAHRSVPPHAAAALAVRCSSLLLPVVSASPACAQHALRLGVRHSPSPSGVRASDAGMVRGPDDTPLLVLLVSALRLVAPGGDLSDPAAAAAAAAAASLLAAWVTSSPAVAVEAERTGLNAGLAVQFLAASGRAGGGEEVGAKWARPAAGAALTAVAAATRERGDDDASTALRSALLEAGGVAGTDALLAEAAAAADRRVVVRLSDAGRATSDVGAEAGAGDDDDADAMPGRGLGVAVLDGRSASWLLLGRRAGRLASEMRLWAREGFRLDALAEPRADAPALPPSWQRRWRIARDILSLPSSPVLGAGPGRDRGPGSVGPGSPRAPAAATITFEGRTLSAPEAEAALLSASRRAEEASSALRAARRRVEASEREAEAARAEMSSMHGASGGDGATLADLKAAYDSMRAGFRSAQEALTGAEGRAEAAERAAEEARARADKAEADAEVAREEAAGAGGGGADAAELESLRAGKAALEAEAARLREDLDAALGGDDDGWGGGGGSAEAEARAARAEAEAGELRRRCAEAEARLAAAASDPAPEVPSGVVQALQEEVRRASEGRAAAERAAREATAGRAAAQEEATRLAAELRRATQAVGGSMAEALRRARDEAGRATERAQEAEAKCSAMQSQLDRVEGVLASAKRAEAAAAAEATAVRSRLEAQRQEHRAELQRAGAAARATVVRLEEALEEARAEAEEARAETEAAASAGAGGLAGALAGREAELISEHEALLVLCAAQDTELGVAYDVLARVGGTAATAEARRLAAAALGEAADDDGETEAVLAELSMVAEPDDVVEAGLQHAGHETAEGEEGEREGEEGEREEEEGEREEEELTMDDAESKTAPVLAEPWADHAEEAQCTASLFSQDMAATGWPEPQSHGAWPAGASPAEEASPWTTEPSAAEPAGPPPMPAAVLDGLPAPTETAAWQDGDRQVGSQDRLEAQQSHSAEVEPDDDEDIPLDDHSQHAITGQSPIRAHGPPGAGTSYTQTSASVVSLLFGGSGPDGAAPRPSGRRQDDGDEPEPAARPRGESGRDDEDLGDDDESSLLAAVGGYAGAMMSFMAGADDEAKRRPPVAGTAAGKAPSTGPAFGGSMGVSASRAPAPAPGLQESPPPQAAPAPARGDGPPAAATLPVGAPPPTAPQAFAAVPVAGRKRGKAARRGLYPGSAQPAAGKSAVGSTSLTPSKPPPTVFNPAGAPPTVAVALPASSCAPAVPPVQAADPFGSVSDVARAKSTDAAGFFSPLPDDAVTEDPVAAHGGASSHQLATETSTAALFGGPATPIATDIPTTTAVEAFGTGSSPGQGDMGDWF